MGQHLVQSWMLNKDQNATHLSIPPHLQNAFENSRKKDDLTDSLLTGLAYLQWLEQAALLRKSNT